MKKSLLLKRIAVLSTFLLIAWQFSSAQIIMIEEFDYPNGALLTSNGWVASSSGGTQPIDVIVPGLSFTGYPSSGIGGAAQVDNNGEDDYKIFTAQTSGSVYAAFLVKVNAIADGYFVNLGPNFTGRLFLKTVGSNFYFGLSKSTETVTYTTTEYTVGTTYLVVVKYEIVDGTVNDKLSLFVFDSSIPTTEPTTPTIPAITGTAADVNPNQIALRQFNSAQRILVDGIRIATSWTDAISDVLPPVPSFNPANSATDVLINVAPTITFDEPVRKTDGSALENSDLAGLITFKKTNSGGDNVPFTAAIDASKKVITITPSSSLNNSQLYYLAVGAVEDASGNESTASNITFTTIAAATPTVTLTYPVGGETFYASDPITLTWTSANVTNIMIEAWVVSDSRTWKWETLVSSTAAAAGSYSFSVPADALYGTQYKIRLSDAGNPAVKSESGSFTCIAVATSLADLRTSCILDDIVKLTSEVTVTFKRATGNQKYVQDATAGLIVYDPSAVLTTPLNIGDNFKNLEGKVAFYGGVYEIIPTKTTVVVTSSGNTVTIPEMTLTEYATNHLNYESELIRLSDVIFPAADGSQIFNPASNNNLTDGSATIIFRAFSTGESDIVGAVIPTGHIKMTCLGGFYNLVVQVYSRTLADFEILPTAVEKLYSDDEISIFPNPASSLLNISNVPGLKSIDILDVTGKVIRTINSGTDELLQIPVSTLRRGMYMIRFNTAEGKVVKRFVKS